MNDMVVLLNADGSVNTDFDPAGAINNDVNTVAVATIEGQQRFLIGGQFTNANGNDFVAALNLDGSFYGFSPSTRLNNEVYSVETVTLGGEPNILVGGVFADVSTVHDSVVLLNSNGTVNDSFKPFATLSGGAVLSAIPTTVGGEQKYLVGGAFQNAGGNNHIALFNSNGTLDTSFEAGTTFGGGGSYIRSVSSTVVNGEQRFFAGGEFNAGGNYRVALLGTNGKLDPKFTPGTTFNDTVTSVVPIEIGGKPKFLTGGSFTNVDGNNRVVILNAPERTPVAPGAPGTPTATWVNPSSVQVDITPPTTGDAPSMYVVTSQPGELTCTVVATANPRSCVVTGLQPSQNYQFVVTAINDAGSSTSAPSNTVNTGPSGKPNKVRKLRVDGSLNASKYDVKWVAPTGATSAAKPVDHYTISIKQKGYAKTLVSKKVSKNKLYYKISRSTLRKQGCTTCGNLAQPLQYVVKVRAVNARGNGPLASTAFVSNRY